MKDKARLHFATFKTLRRYLLEDYYPLSPQPIDLASWSGWQFNDPKDRPGFLQTFRTRTLERMHSFFVKGLGAQARYRFSDAYSSDTFEMPGAAAITKGISIEQEPMTSKVLVYRASALPMVIMLVHALIVFAPVGAMADPSSDIRERWATRTSAFTSAMQGGAGFSFSYEGKAVGPVLSEDWHPILVRDEVSGVTRTVFKHSSGLTVTRETRTWADSDAVEYRLRFRNDAKTTLLPVSAIQALNITLDESFLHGSCIISSGGGLNDALLPPKSFAIRTGCISPTAPDYAQFELSTQGGRSSNGDLPFFFIQNDRHREGAFIAIGWSGQWEVKGFQRARSLNLSARIPDIAIALEPGEEIEGPTILIGPYEGMIADGSNALRRLIRDHYTPKLSDKPFLPVSTYDTWYSVDVRFDESVLRKLVDGAAEMQQEYFLLDAGWFANPTGKGFLTGVGNWDGVDPKRLPNGLKPVSDYVRSKGMKFGLWFEPERVGPETQLAQEHPDWVLWKHTAQSETSFNEAHAPRFGLLDYGRPDVQRWVREMLDRHIREQGIKYIRYDLNLDPLPYWDANDQPDRRGLTQLRHIHGLYAVMDWIHRRHPDVVLESCASGGRRIDLEMVRRFHAFWISDHSADPAVVRFHLSGVNYFLPGNYNYVQYVLPTAAQKDFQPDDFDFQQMFGGAIGLGARIDLWPKEMKAKALVHIAAHKRIRRYLMEDYYPLSEQPADLTSWSGWQFNDPEDQSGFVQTFRTNTSDATHRFAIRGLAETARYRFTDAYGTHSFDVTGLTAMTQGIEVTQEAMSSKVLIYKKMRSN